MRLGILALLISALTACGSGGPESSASGGGSPPPPPPPPPANTPPQISGTPATTVLSGDAYSFAPTAVDADNDPLTYSIDNAPVWASFDTDLGTLSGTPDDIHIGVSVDISISVSDGTSTASLPMFDIEVLPIPLGSATVRWDAPTTNADGTPLLDLAGFVVYFGAASGSYDDDLPVNDPNATSALIVDLPGGQYFFSVSAVDSVGNESNLSDEVTFQVVP